MFYNCSSSKEHKFEKYRKEYENEKEIKRTYLNKNEKINAIKIIIDYQIKSFNKLFFFVKLLNQYILKTFIEII